MSRPELAQDQSAHYSAHLLLPETNPELPPHIHSADSPYHFLLSVLTHQPKSSASEGPSLRLAGKSLQFLQTFTQLFILLFTPTKPRISFDPAHKQGPDRGQVRNHDWDREPGPLRKQQLPLWHGDRGLPKDPRAGNRELYAEHTGRLFTGGSANTTGDWR